MTQHVLLIEDEPNIAEAIRFLLTRDGMRVSHAAEGAAALALLREEPPDMVILDHMLPGLSGLEILTAIRAAPDQIAAERAGLEHFLHFVRGHKEIYRIIDEAEFVDPASYREHYETIAARIADRLRAGAAAGEFRDGLGELEAWATMGMNVFVGLRYVVWADGKELSPDAVAAGVNRLLAEGLLRR